MKLTRRELEVANLVAEGLTNRATAARLHLSERTIEGHIEHALNKLGMSSRTQLAVWLGRSGLASPSAQQVAPSIPRQMTSFVGREKDIQGLRHLLADQRIVTLAGAGGSGKTRLAFEVAYQMQLEGKQKVWFVDLSAITDAGLVIQAVAGSLGVAVEDTLGSPVAERFRDAKGVLLLDNCEHLAEAVASLVASMAAICSGIQFLITSRESLRIPGEHVWRVQPLSTPPIGAAVDLVLDTESVRLFVDRARAIVSTFEIDEATCSAIGEVCRRLDGLPLAIELAAARVGLLSPAQIANRLDDRFALLVAESPLRPDRQRTLRAALQWSYELLPASERALFRRLGVFNGSFNLEAAEAVCGFDPLPRAEVLPLLGRLADRSLVVVTGTTRDENRYRLLDSTRTYSAELLSTEEAQHVAERHARLYAAIALEAGDRLGGPDAHDWTDLVAEEMDNLRSALEWAIANDRQLALGVCASLAGYWDLQGLLYEGRRWLRRALDGDLTSTPNRAAALAAAGSLAFRQADYSSALEFFKQSLAIAESVANRALSARALAGLGDVLNLTNDPDGAADKYRVSLELYQAEGDRLSVARGLTRLAGVANVRRDFQAAEQLAQQSLAQFRLLGDRAGIANQLFTIGAARINMKKYASARDYIAQSLELRREIGDSIGTAYSCVWMACSDILAGNLAAACEPLASGLTACESAGDLRGLSMGLDMTLGLLLKAGSAAAGLRVEAAAQNIRALGGFQGMPPFQPVLDKWIAEAQNGLPLREAEYEDSIGRSLTAASALQFATAQIRSIQERLSSKQGATYLTPRESEIARLVADGLSNREIGVRMNVSERTVDTHLQHVLNKLGFRSRTQIAAWQAGRRGKGDVVLLQGKHASHRFVTTILVVDMVGSTSKVSQIGDTAWRKLLDQHYEKVRMELLKHDGVEVDTAGDGMLATFDGPASAIRCAWAIQRDDRALGLASRAGIHSGEVERADSAIRGIAVHIAARLAGLGLADEVIVSGTTRELAAGSGIRFESRGRKRLKGVPDTQRVFAAAS
jgi:predicted ATPase/DNA-binding NarL/FixJ family response regulator